MALEVGIGVDLPGANRLGDEFAAHEMERTFVERGSLGHHTLGVDLGVILHRNFWLTEAEMRIHRRAAFGSRTARKRRRIAIVVQRRRAIGSNDRTWYRLS